MATAIRSLTAGALLVLTPPALHSQDGPILEAPVAAERQTRSGGDDFVLPPPPAQREDAADAPAERREQPPEFDVPVPPAPRPEAALEPDARPLERDARPLEHDWPLDRGYDQPYENYLGVTMDRVSDALAAQLGDLLAPGEGVLVRSVVAGSAAEEAGLRANDILLAYDGQPLTSSDDVKRLVVNDEPGATVELTIIRSARPQTVTVTLGQRPVAPLEPPQHVPAEIGPVPGVPGPFPIDIPGPRSIVIDRYGFRSPWVAVDWGSPLAGRRFQALTPRGRVFDVEVRVFSGPRRR